MRTLPFVVTTAAAAAGAVSAQVRTWSAPGSGSWNAAPNWTPANVPDTAAEFAVLSLPAPFTVTLGASVTVGGIDLNPFAEVGIADGVILALESSLVNNDGRIVVNPSAGGLGARLEIGAIDGTFDGVGTILLNAGASPDGALLSASAVTGTLGADQTVAGRGRVYGSWINNGLIEARGASGYIGWMDPGINNGIFRAAVGTTAELDATTLSNASGQIIADGGTIVLNASTVTGGVVSAIHAGSWRNAGTSTLIGVTLGGAGEIPDGTVLVHRSGLVNNGAITVGGGAAGAPAILAATTAPAAISGTGTIELRAGSSLDSACLNADGVTETLGLGQRVFGRGRLYGRWVNDGVIEATGASGFIGWMDPGTNNGTVRARPGSAVEIDIMTLANNLGQLVADGGEIWIDGSTVNGGSISAVNGGVWRASGDSVLIGVTSGGPGAVPNGATLDVRDGLTNNGEITVNSGGTSPTQIRLSSASSTVGGGGSIVLEAAPGDLDTAQLNAGGVTGTIGPDQSVRGEGRMYGAWIVEGTLAPGVSVGRLEPRGPLTMRPGATLAVDLGGTAPGEFDRVLSASTITVDGTLRVSLIGGFVPQIGDTFAVASGTGLSGEFGAIAAPELDDARFYVRYDGTTVTLGVSCPTDFNGDGFITGDDFDEFIAAFEIGDPSADYDRNDFVNGDDFDAFNVDFIAGCE